MQLLAAQDFACNICALNRLRRIPAIPMKMKNLSSGGRGYQSGEIPALEPPRSHRLRCFGEAVFAEAAVLDVDVFDGV
jgi:hypothetical protein